MSQRSTSVGTSSTQRNTEKGAAKAAPFSFKELRLTWQRNDRVKEPDFGIIQGQVLRLFEQIKEFFALRLRGVAAGLFELFQKLFLIL